MCKKEKIVVSSGLNMPYFLIQRSGLSLQRLQNKGRAISAKAWLCLLREALLGGLVRIAVKKVLIRELYKTVLLFSESARSPAALSSGNGSLPSAVGDVSDSPLSRSILLAMLTAGS